jgi:hypothetical protein
VWTGFQELRIGFSTCKHGNESGSTSKVRGFLDKLSDYQFPKKDFAT